MSKTDHRSGNTNTVVSGLRSGRNLLLPGESAGEFEALLGAYADQLRPRTVAEYESVVRMVGLRWKLKRVDGREDAALKGELDRQVGLSTERKDLDVVTRALAIVTGLLDMVPFFARVEARQAEQTLLRGAETALSMVDATAARIELPLGVLGDLAGATKKLQFLFLATGAPSPVPGPEYLAALEGLRVAVERSRAALLAAETVARTRLASKTEELAQCIKLSISVVRLLDRYRVALERSLVREVEYLRFLVDHREKEEASFGSGLPPPFPAIELKLVQ